jgi:uncharacterized protein involved in response to NO
MIGGFLTAFTTGFLMTAVPRFTGTFPPDPYEIGFSLLALLLLPYLSWYSVSAGSTAVLLAHGNLIAFFMRRFLRKRAPLAEPFLFIPASLSVSVVGHMLIVMSSLGWINSSYYPLGRLLAFNAFMLGIVLGVGSKIIPVFTGYGPRANGRRGLIYILIALFFGSFLVQDFIDLGYGLRVRFLIILFVALRTWSIYQLPPNPSKISWGLWLSCWGFVIGALGGALFPSEIVQWNHILFIFGFGLMTLMIGSRVILSHGGFDLSKEGEHPWIVTIIGSLILASVARLILYFVPGLTNLMFILSSSLWLLGLIFWWIHVGRRTFHRNPQKMAQGC